LGGAVASLMAADLKISFPSELSRVRCVTFGSPKVFSESSAEIVKELRIESIRVQLEGDPIPHFPLNTLQHSASDLIYLKDGYYIWSDYRDENLSTFLSAKISSTKVSLQGYLDALTYSKRKDIRDISDTLLLDNQLYGSSIEYGNELKLTFDNLLIKEKLHTLFKTFKHIDFNKSGASPMHWSVYQGNIVDLHNLLSEDPGISDVVDPHLVATQDDEGNTRKSSNYVTDIL
jgi:hypothetical protein